MDAIRACKGFFYVIAASVSDFCLQGVDCLDSLISSDDSAIMYLILLLINSIVGHPYEDPLLAGIREQVMEAVLDEEFWDECYKASRTVTDKKTSEMSSTTVDMTVVSASRQCCICLEEFQEGKLIPQCHHVFHPGCIDIWLKSHSSCPLCRGHVS